MPELSAVAATLGVPFTLGDGRSVRAVLRPPPPAASTYDVGANPRRTLIVSKDAKLPRVGLVTDRAGNHFLHALWSGEGLLGEMAVESHVLFAVTGNETWTRQVFTTEPISGQRVAGTPADLGAIPVVREKSRIENDNLRVEEEVYRVLCLVDLQVGDYLANRRVTYVESVLGLTTAEVF
jgi:hypothetical protein